MTVEGGSGCLKELSIPAALFIEERLKQSVPLQRPNIHTDGFCPWSCQQMEMIDHAQPKD